MSRHIEVQPNPRSILVVISLVVAAGLATAFVPVAFAQSNNDESDRAQAASTPAPLPTREQILSDPFLRNALSRSTEGLEVVRRSDGSLMVDLQGRFQSISTARIDSEGGVEIGCAETHDSLADFLTAHPPERVPVPASGGDEAGRGHE